MYQEYFNYANCSTGITYTDCITYCSVSYTNTHANYCSTSHDNT